MMLRLENVKKHYGEFDLNCSLAVQPGRVTGLVGQNGSGKSLTFKCILNLVQTEGGTIEVFGKPADTLTDKDREDIGVVLANACFEGHMTVKDICAFMKKMYKKFDEDLFRQQCEHLGIPADRKIREFSGGMKAGLKLLSAMSHEAKLLILDEPTVGLDVIAREELLDLMRAYMENGERSILISSHISSDLEGLCDDIYIIDGGKIILHEETDVLLDQYGVIKVTEEDYRKLDKQYLLKRKKEPFGCRCLTNEKQFYIENFPQVTIENGTIDDMLAIMVRGEPAAENPEQEGSIKIWR